LMVDNVPAKTVASTDARERTVMFWKLMGARYTVGGGGFGAAD
jgi:hypothetical protein